MTDKTDDKTIPAAAHDAAKAKAAPGGYQVESTNNLTLEDGRIVAPGDKLTLPDTAETRALIAAGHVVEVHADKK